MLINTIKQYTLGALLLVSPLILTSSNYNQNTPNNNIVKNIVEKKEESKPISVKTGVGTTYHYSKLDVEKSLDSLCRDRNTVLEDAWMFHNNSLTDIGLYEDKSSITLYWSYDSMDNCKYGDTLIIYHIHPNPYNKPVFSPPSITDIINDAQLRQNFSNNNINIIEKIFDGKGMWELNLSKELTTKINNKQEHVLDEYAYIDLLINKNNYLWYITGITQNTILEKYNNIQSDNSAIKKYINTMNDLGIKLKFIPREDIGK
jgi:hypothetical protein